MGIKIKTFLDCVEYVCNIKKPVLLRARHGVGKSSIVYQLAEQKSLPVVERRASQMTEGDLLGLPVITGESTTWMPPDWFIQACDSPCILFIDELDRAVQEVKQGFFELTDSRKIAGKKLHEDTLIFAAINGGEDGGQYMVNDMDPAELDRWTVFDLTPDTRDWLTWAVNTKSIIGPIIDFITENKSFLEHDGDFEPNKVYPSRRSWHRLSDCLSNSNLLKSEDITKNMDIIVSLTASFVGSDASFKFIDYLKTSGYMLSLDDIIDRGMYAKAKNFSINENGNLVDKLIVNGVFQDLLSDPILLKKNVNGKDKRKKEDIDRKIDNLFNWMLTIQGELAIRLWNELAELDFRNDDSEKVDMEDTVYSYILSRTGPVVEFLNKVSKMNQEIPQ